MDKLEEIKGRLEAITPGEWEYAHAGAYRDGKPELTEYFVRVVDDDVSIAADILDPKTSKPSEENAAFIATAPEDIRWLVGEVKRLREWIKPDTNRKPFNFEEGFTVKVDPSLPPNSLKIGDTLVTNIGLPDDTETNLEDKPRKRHDWFTPKHR